MARPGEATEDQRAAFAHALSGHLEGDKHAVSSLADKLGVDRNTIYYWRSGEREPQRAQVFRMERELGLPGGGLSHLLGYLPADSSTDTVAAIRRDPRLTDGARAALLDAYDSATAASNL